MSSTEFLEAYLEDRRQEELEIVKDGSADDNNAS